MQDELKEILQEAIKDLGGKDVVVTIERPSDPKHGDYTSNVALMVSKKLGKNPREIAEGIAKSVGQTAKSLGLEKVEVAGAGFVNFYLSTGYLLGELQKILENDDFVPTTRLKNKKYMVEYAHPNTHKEMHIGHMRTLITGEAIARLLAANGATVFRANYQGDIGPHVAKALWGILELMKERKLTLAEVSDWSNGDKAHFLGEGYAKGSAEYEDHKEEIDRINSELYKFVISSTSTRLPMPGTGGQASLSVRNPMGSLTRVRDDMSVENLYIITRQWSLDYYQDFYERFYTKSSLFTDFFKKP